MSLKGGQVTRAVKRQRKMLQYRPEVVDGFQAGTGLTLSSCASEGAEEASPPGGPLNVRGQSARPVVVALQQFLGNYCIAKLDQRPVDLGKVSAVQLTLGLSFLRSEEGTRVVRADQR